MLIQAPTNTATRGAGAMGTMALLTLLGTTLTGGYELVCVPRFTSYDATIQELRADNRELRRENTEILVNLAHRSLDPSS
ncbi:MAG: hypothetical protein AAF978_00690 [Cyanobacteria bacterium P01_E01_bin.48]